MARYVLKRLVYLVAILWTLTVVIFGITQVLPGNVAKMIVGQFQDPTAIAAIEQKLGLNDPLPLQYWRWFSRVLHGDLGDSLVMQRPITPIVLDAFVNTMSLAVVSIVCVAVVGVALGVLGADDHGADARSRFPGGRDRGGGDGLCVSRFRPADRVRHPAARSALDASLHRFHFGDLRPGEPHRRPALRLLRPAHTLRSRVGLSH